MISLGIKSDIDQLAGKFDALANRQVPFATALALTRTANLAKAELSATLSRVFDRPTPFTLNSLFVKPANKTTLTATVGHKTGSPVNRYLRWEIEGGQRAHKGLENLANSITGGSAHYLVPARGLRLDAYGNVPSSTARRIAERIKSRDLDLLVVRPGARTHLAPGVYERVGRGKDSLKALLIFVSKAHYSAVYDMPSVVGRVVNAEFGRQFAIAMEQALATARLTL